MGGSFLRPAPVFNKRTGTLNPQILQNNNVMSTTRISKDSTFGNLLSYGYGKESVLAYLIGIIDLKYLLTQ